MRIVIRCHYWRPARASEGLSAPGCLIEAASRTNFYQRHRQELAGGVWTPLETLRGLPVTPLESFQARRREFENKGMRRRPRAVEYPFEPAPRLAVLDGGFQTSRQCRYFPESKWGEVARFAPEALAGYGPTLGKFIAGVQAGRWEKPRLDRTVLAWHTAAAGCVTTEVRQQIWDLFGSPVQEQWLGVDGEVLAEECELRDGLHLRIDAALVELIPCHGVHELVVTSYGNLAWPVLRLATGLTAEMVTLPCLCGGRAYG